MRLPVFFLIVSIVGLWHTANAIRPPKREPFSNLVFFPGWLTSELPLQIMLLQAVGLGLFVAGGAIEGTAGLVGLGLTALSWVGLVAMAVQAHRAGAVLEAAMAEGLGGAYRPPTDPPSPIQWARLALPFHLRSADVSVTKNVAYLPDATKFHRLDVFRGKNAKEEGGAPVLLYVHGGGWVIGDKKEQGLPMMNHLAGRGWVCVSANYRLSPKATWPDHLVDTKAALAWVKEHIAEYGGDPDQVVISGGSAGGHIAAVMALTANDPEYQPGFEHVDTSVVAGVPIYGVYDLTNRLGFRSKGFVRFLAKTVMKSTAAADPLGWAKASAMDRVATAPQIPPMFLIHGRNDTLVPVGEARHMASLLRAKSQSPVVYAELPGAQHAFEIFHSLRTAHLVVAIERFLGTVVPAADRR